MWQLFTRASQIAPEAGTGRSWRLCVDLVRERFQFLWPTVEPERGCERQVRCLSKVVTMANVFDIAKYFLMMAASGEEDAGESMTHLKLQKLLYYAQGFHLAIFNKGLFADTVLAWKQGPVVPSVWKNYKQHGSEPIPPADGFEPAKCLSEDEQELLNAVWNSYGQFSAWKLRNMTHDEPPWRAAYKPDENAIISEKSMAEYFATQIEQ